MNFRFYIREMWWALEEINSRNHDRNPNRAAQLRAAIDYGLEIARACEEGETVSRQRPDLDKAV